MKSSALVLAPARGRLRAWAQAPLPQRSALAMKGAKLSVHGIDLELVRAPGETPDHIVVWYPEKKVLISGDNFYRSFPALYPPRGSAYRDFDAWADTLDLLMSFGPDVLGPGHTKAVFGADTIKGALTDYRDAIRHIVR